MSATTISTIERNHVGQIQTDSAGGSGGDSPLVIVTSTVSHGIAADGVTITEKDDQRVQAIMRRFALQSGARDLLPEERVSTCLRHPHAPVVDVWHVPETNTAHFGGLMVCGSVWQCPACAAKISEKRRGELSEAVQRWHAPEHGGNVIMVTLTLRHNRNDTLDSLVESLREAWRQLKQGAGWQSIKANYGIVGIVTAFELTHGRSGWHPHLHALIFVKPTTKFAAFSYILKKRWLRALERIGADATWQHGCDVRAARADIADYIAKWGKEPTWTVAHELAKSVSKRGKAGGYTPLELLCAYTFDNDQEAGRLWVTYARAMKGKNQLTWSPGLRALLGMLEEKTDEELATEREKQSIKLASLSLHQWRIILANDARAELLIAAGTGDIDKVNDFLDTLGVVVVIAPQMPEPPEPPEPVQMGLLPPDDMPDRNPSLTHANHLGKRLSRVSYETGGSPSAAHS